MVLQEKVQDIRDTRGTNGRENVVTIVFDASKNNQFNLQQGFKILTRRLKTSGFKVVSNKDELQNETLNQATIFIIASPREKYSETQLNQLKKYLNGGGKIWLMLGDGGDRKHGSNVNQLLESTGISINNDSVIRNSYYKYLHPKEALITNGILNRGFLTAAAKLRNLTDNRQDSPGMQSINYVYPFGSTLNVTKPGIGILSTGSVCYPLNRPTVAFYIEKNSGGKLVVIGASQMFSDNYIEKEDNSLIKDIILEFLLEPAFPIDQIDSEDPEISDYNTVPDMSLLAEEPLACLQETEDVPSDYTKLFSKQLYETDNTHFAKVTAVYKEFHMEREPLKLIKPQFEAPLPNLEPAVFPPNFRCLPKPNLELFDLDQAFSSIPTRLAQIVNKCTDDDLDYYIKECAMVQGIQGAEKLSSKEILESIFNKIVLYKKINIDKD